MLQPDNCTDCCPEGVKEGARLSCCDTSQRRDLFGTPKGECSGLPCCKYAGPRPAPKQSWYPCMMFTSCQNDQTKTKFCGGQAPWSFTAGSNFTCSDNCCMGVKLTSNVWVGMKNAMPGQINATFAITFSPTDFIKVFYGSSERGAAHPLQQIVLESPPDYKFGPNPSCSLRMLSASEDKSEVAQCFVSTFGNKSKTYLIVNIGEKFRGDEQFVFTFDSVQTPSGVDPSQPPNVLSTDWNLSPVHFLFDDVNGNVFSTFVRTATLGSAVMSSGSFLPENIYPGNSGNASLVFFTNARVPSGSAIDVKFSSRWGFGNGGAAWAWQSVPEAVVPLINNSSSSGSADAGQPGLTLHKFSDTSYSSATNTWTLPVKQDIERGWITLAVDKVQNPTMAYSGLNQITVRIRDSEQRLIVENTFSSISVDMISDATASPYNYVTMVVLIFALLFCTIVIRSNGLAFSYGSIWTDLTAICTILALVTALLNNLLWTFSRGSLFFYLSRLHLCFTFTMLTAVCFHWGTVLSLSLRKLPKTTTCLSFILINVLFYAFQVVFLFYHRKLISSVYKAEANTSSLANQQCKHESDISNNVFSEIQGYLWSCYAQNEDKFFLVSTTVTFTLFLVLTFIVMFLGVMVMRRGKLLLGHATAAHQIVLMKALRLYYALIGVVTLVYLLSWIVQILSRRKGWITYPWFYIFTVWLPYTIPPCCLIFLQWNNTAKTLREAETGDANSPRSEWYDEIRTPSFAFSTTEGWAQELVEELENTTAIESEYDGEAAAPAVAEDHIGLSMSLEMNEKFANGCFVGIQRLQYDELTNVEVWKQVANTDTVEAVAVASGRYLYSFMSVPRIGVTPSDEKVRMIVYALQNDLSAPVNPNHHSEVTAAVVLAALERKSSSDDEDRNSLDDEIDSPVSGFVDMDALQSSRVIEELFEGESDTDSSDGSAAGKCLNVVAEFSISTELLVDSGARGELAVVTATENSYKQFGPSMLPPKLSVHTVIPKTIGAKYGVRGASNVVHSMSSQYHIREQGLLVVEDLTESRFSNLIPRQILEIIIRHRTKRLMMAENDLARLESFDRQRQKGSDRGIYENLIQQIQDDGDVNRCREWMIQRCKYKKDYVELLRRLRRVYVMRDQKQRYFKPSTEKKNPELRFLPINLHIQEMWVGTSSRTFVNDNDLSDNAVVYDIVTVGAMAAHVYKFKNGGILGLEEQRLKMKSRPRDEENTRQCPLWTEEEQKAADLDWEIQQRMDVCFPQAVAALVTAFTRKVDLALQSYQVDAGRRMLEQMEKLGFVFNVESLISTHGNEAGMLEDMAGAVNELRNVRFVLVDENAPRHDVAVSFHDDEESKDETEFGSSTMSSASSRKSLAGVVSVDVFTSLEDALEDAHMHGSAGAPGSPTHSVATSNSSFTVRHRLMNTFMKAKSGKLLRSMQTTAQSSSSAALASLDRLFEFSNIVIRVTLRSGKVQLPEFLLHGGTVQVHPLLFSQGINEKQTLANNTGSSVTRLQDVINENSLRSLRTYCDRFANYRAGLQCKADPATAAVIAKEAPGREEVMNALLDLEKLIAQSRQTRRKRPEILQLSSDLCRRMGAGRVTVCKSAKDRTGMSVTLEQGRILVQNHGLPEGKKADIVSVMRSEGVRIENALKNTGRRVFAFNALQRSLLPEEYRCPPQTGGRNMS
ncbi:TPA: hypothetical protein N0F65_004392 [Lagenidium giganteum]|uniref:Uncharacterized protein n=1 Tax=Lagenidium giganteum TaxID=4803 RepID=A0AAV2ZG86_9STRA|nr:TPA: hypothetical protein N0F65_004392 [Lagenidium giganteum]